MKIQKKKTFLKSI